MKKEVVVNNGIAVTYNAEQGGIEIRVPYGRNLTAEELAELKRLKFSWAKGKHLWYALFSEDLLKQMQESKLGFLKEAAYPKLTKTLTEKLSKVSAEKMAKRAERAATASKERAGYAEQLKAQQEMIASLSGQVAQLLAALNK